ncbi:DUF4382 domain-containing protein [Hymenobacter sp. NBH84]|uniref:DUF4382 domain-containing protein n=1 Tax=Hymenobacter sp. NBH84 TaxID=2596915 RepID=UPI0021566207|nr:DUF4382 domain-containing protein [Hymenobacter sp. NBH84]
MKTTLLYPLALAAFLALGGCSKDSGSNMAKMEVLLADAPGDFSAVMLDVQQVQIHADDTNDENGWQALPLLKAGQYNVLDFVNGRSALLASADFPPGRISQIRLVLGANNYLVTRDGTRYDLKTPSAQTSGLKLKIDADLTQDVTYTVLLDFDVAKSIVERGNGNKADKDRFLLKPVIRAITTAVAGGIKGSVTPTTAQPQVLAIRTSTVPNDTLSTFADASGGFLLRGVPAGTYRVEFFAPSPLKHVVRTGVTVTNTQITDLGSVDLK